MLLQRWNHRVQTFSTVNPLKNTQPSFNPSRVSHGTHFCPNSKLAFLNFVPTLIIHPTIALTLHVYQDLNFSSVVVIGYRVPIYGKHPQLVEDIILHVWVVCVWTVNCWVKEPLVHVMMARPCPQVRVCTLRRAAVRVFSPSQAAVRLCTHKTPRKVCPNSCPRLCRTWVTYVC